MMMIVSKDLPIAECFRVPFVTQHGRDGLSIDIPILTLSPANKLRKVVRICTTYLEEGDFGGEYRLGQLTFLSSQLHGKPHMGSIVVAGLIAGDTNIANLSEH